ncbi:MAG: DNA internalization-related competence protein ComEC/Rec2 [Desulfomonile sp.]|nr:DNA internalization-related competence protein ComEC/Rec2 [Desulfomonile sp.]
MTRGILSALDRYPSAAALLLLVAGIILARLAHPSSETLLLSALTIALAVLFAAVRYGDAKFLWVAVSLLFLAAGFHRTGTELAIGEDFTPPSDKQIIHATLVETWSSNPGLRVLLVESAVDAQRGAPLPGRGRLLVRDNPIRLVAGDRISFRTHVRRPENRGNPGEYDWELYCRTNGVLWTASVRGADSLLVMQRAPLWSPSALVSRMRDRVTRFIEEHSTGDVRAVLKGLVVGDRGEVGPALNRAYTDSGLVHVLSASGLHVAFAAALAVPLVAVAVRVRPALLLRVPYTKLAAAGSLLPMLVYCFLAGARTPIVRSTIMGIVAAVAILLDRKWYSINSLALAGVLILLVYPLSLFALDFQLSFVAVLGILLIVPQAMTRLNRREPQTEAAAVADRNSGHRDALARVMRSAGMALFATGMTTPAATLAVSPILIEVFRVIPVYGIAANITVLPLLTPALPLALAGSLVGLMFPRIGAVLLAPAEILIHWTNYIAEFFAGLPFSVVHLPEAGLPGSMGAACLFAAVIVASRLKRARGAVAAVTMGCIAAAALMGVSAVWSDKKTLSIVFFNVGKADAAYVKPPGSAGVLIDGGMRTDSFDAGESILVPFFRRSGVQRLDGMVISHPDMDHMGGLLTIARSVPPERVWLNMIDYSPRFLNKVLETAVVSGARISAADRTSGAVQLGPAAMTFLNKPGGRIRRDHSASDVNNASAVCRFDYGEVSFLFTGDLAEEGENELLSAGVPLRASVLKVGHHGCKRSTTRRFLDAVRPEIAVISCDVSPRGTCPDATVIADLESVGARIYWTGRDGAVTVETDGKQLTVKTGKKSMISKTGAR